MTTSGCCGLRKVICARRTSSWPTATTTRPDLPDWPGADGFTGELLHASAYRNAKPYVGKDVLVVGAGNTGAEIALDLLETGASSVKVSIRTPPHIIFRQLNGIANPVLGVAFRHLPPRIFDPIARRMRDADPRRSERVRAAGARLTGCTSGCCAMMRSRSSTWGSSTSVKAGKVTIVAAVVGFDGDKVRLADGSSLAVDAVVAATGYRRGLDPLVGDLGVLGEDGRPVVRGGRTAPAGAESVVQRIHQPGQWDVS